MSNSALKFIAAGSFETGGTRGPAKERLKTNVKTSWEEVRCCKDLWSHVMTHGILNQTLFREQVKTKS